jgi:hypothetical protein
MPDRILRDEILESDRWLGLPSADDRLVYIALLLRCDDFGNLEGGLSRLFRFVERFTSIKSAEHTALTLLHLVDADLIRRYEVDGRELYHIPRFRPHQQYLTRKMPASPWDSERKLGKHKRIEIRGLAKEYQQSTQDNIDVNVTSQLRNMDVAEGVGVGVGVGVKHVSNSGLREPSRARAREQGHTAPTAIKKIEDQTPTPLTPQTPAASPAPFQTVVDAWWKSTAGVNATANTLGLTQAVNEDDAAFRDRVYAAVEESKRQAQLAEVARRTSPHA